MLTPRPGRWGRSIGHRRLRTVAVSLARCGSPTPCDSERRSGGDAIGADTADAASEKSSSVCEGASREGRATGIPVGTGEGLELPTVGCPHGVRDESYDRRGPDWHRVQTPVLVVRCGVDAPSRRADETRGTGATGGRPRPWREIAHLPGRIAGSRDAGKRDQGGRHAHVADRRTVVGHLGAPREATPAFSVWDAHRRLGPLVRVCSAVASTGVPPVVLGAADPRPDAIRTSVSGSAPAVMELIWTYARRTAPRGAPCRRATVAPASRPFGAARISVGWGSLAPPFSAVSVRRSRWSHVRGEHHRVTGSGVRTPVKPGARTTAGGVLAGRTTRLHTWDASVTSRIGVCRADSAPSVPRFAPRPWRLAVGGGGRCSRSGPWRVVSAPTPRRRVARTTRRRFAA
jgi:hypothetical protein